MAGNQENAKLLQEGLELQQAGKVVEAKTLYQRVLANDATNSDALNLLGVIEAQGGNLPESLKLLQQAIAINDTVPDYVINLSVVLAQSGRGEEALQKIREGMRTFSGDPRFAGLELQALMTLGRPGEIVEKCKAILENESENIEVLLQLALAQMQIGEGRDAFETTKRAQKIKPQSKSVIQTLAASAMAANEWAVAVQAFDVLTKVEPGSPVLWADWSRAEYELGNKKRAIEKFEKFMTVVPQKMPDHYFMLGRLYFQDRQPLKAAENLDKAIEVGFTNSELLAIRANCYIHENNKEKAREFFEAAIELNPNNVEAHIQHRQFVETKKNDPLFKQMKNLRRKGGLEPKAEIILEYLLGDLHHAVKEYNEAFPYYWAGNTKTKSLYAKEGVKYDPEAVKEEFERLKQVFSKAALGKSKFKGHNSEFPVFIVGMPRSGTTLLEQIISSHGQAEGRGELNAMHLIHAEMENAIVPHPKVSLDNILEKHGRTWAAQYLEDLGETRTGTKRVTDKLPANFRSLGLIARIFPKARFVHIHRVPLDTCLSIFCNSFDTGHPYANALEDIGDYYRQYWDLMNHWHAVLGKRLLKVSYEDLVAHQEKISKEIIAFCGLDWDERCLSFHEKPDAAMTISSVQVRNPMNTSSIGRWKNYKKLLEPLIESLGPDLVKAKK